MWEKLRDACYRFALLRFREVAQAYAAIPGDGTRIRELWRPLQAILQELRVAAREVAMVQEFFMAGAKENRHEVDVWEEVLMETLREKALAAAGSFEMTAEDILQAMGLEGEVKPGPRWLGNALSRFNLYLKRLPRYSDGERRRKVQPYLFDSGQVLLICKTYLRDTFQNEASHASQHEFCKDAECLHGTEPNSGTRPVASQEAGGPRQAEDGAIWGNPPPEDRGFGEDLNLMEGEL